MVDFSGTFLPVTTPFDPVTGDVDVIAFRANLRHWFGNPIRGILVAGSTGESVLLDPGRKVVINPGSVGQPRDGDPRASCAIYDSETQSVTLHRVEYDIGSTQKLMEEAELPRWLIERLSEGS